MTTSVFTRPSCFAIVAGSTTVSGFGAGVTGARNSLVQAHCERPDAPVDTTRRGLATNSRGPAADDRVPRQHKSAVAFDGTRPRSSVAQDNSSLRVAYLRVGSNSLHYRSAASLSASPETNGHLPRREDAAENATPMICSVGAHCTLALCPQFRPLLHPFEGASVAVA